MAFKMDYQGFAPIRSNTPLHQNNVSTNESFGVNEKGERVKRTTTTTPDQVIKGTPAPPPVITKKPGKRKKYTGMDNMCSAEYKAVYGSKRCDEYNSRPPKPPVIVPPTEAIVEGKGTPDQIIPGSKNVVDEIIPRPTVDGPPSLGVASNREGNTSRSGIGNFNIPIPKLDINLGKLELPSFRGIRNLIRGCKGGGCPKY